MKMMKSGARSPTVNIIPGKVEGYLSDDIIDIIEHLVLLRSNFVFLEESAYSKWLNGG